MNKNLAKIRKYLNRNKVLAQEKFELPVFEDIWFGRGANGESYISYGGKTQTTGQFTEKFLKEIQENEDVQTNK